MLAFPDGCDTSEDKLLHAYGVTSQLLEEREEELQKYQSGEISLDAFKSWEKTEWRPRHKHALHVKDLYKEDLGLLPVGEEELAEDKKALKDSLKEAALDKKNGKFKDFYKDKKAKDMVAKWDASFNASYASEWSRVREIGG